MGKRKRIAIAIGLSLVAFAIVSLLLPSIIWCGARTTYFNVTVLDSNTGRPVPNAIIRCVREKQPEYRLNQKLQFARKTDASGRTRIMGMFGAGGTSNGFWRTGSVSYSNHWIVAEATAYDPYMIEVVEFTGLRRSIREKEFDVQIKMKPQTSFSTTLPAEFDEE